MRLLKHPGRPSQPRRVIAEACLAGAWRVTLPPGVELATALVEALVSRGVRQAAIQLLGGSFDSLELQAPRSGGGNAAPVSTDRPPRRVGGPLLLLGGSGVLGRSAEENPLLHCQVVAVGNSGHLEGGLVEPHGCRVGGEGLLALATGLGGAGFVAVQDSETGVSLFEPVSEVA